MSVSIDCAGVPDDQTCQKRKIELCRTFTQCGYCQYGENCHFAHGIEELIQHQPTLKKKKCRNYHQHRYCKFGSRCNFVHEPMHSQGPKQLKSMQRMMQQFPELLPMINFKKQLLHFL